MSNDLNPRIWVGLEVPRQRLQIAYKVTAHLGAICSKQNVLWQGHDQTIACVLNDRSATAHIAAEVRLLLIQLIANDCASGPTNYGAFDGVLTTLFGVIPTENTTDGPDDPANQGPFVGLFVALVSVKPIWART
jgi:hypothetical protein